MQKQRVAVLFGGASPEHQVSLNSACAVLKNFPRDVLDAVPIGIARDGTWFHYTGSLEKIPDGTWNDEVRCYPVIAFPGARGALLEVRDGKMRPLELDMALPMLHGPNGEDGSVQGLLQLVNIPIMGCGPASSALCMDKHRAHEVVARAGIEVPRAVMVDVSSQDSLANRLRGFSYPLFVKPLRGGSSIGISKVHDPDDLEKALGNAFEYDTVALVEEAVPGFEVGCAVIGAPAGESTLLVSRPDEVENPTGFLDYQKKYGESDMRMHLPARVEPGVEERIRDAAEVIYRALGCSGFARVDMFLTPDGRIVFNEVNTIPGFTESSRFPAMAETLGLSFSGLIVKIAETASSRIARGAEGSWDTEERTREEEERQ